MEDDVDTDVDVVAAATFVVRIGRSFRKNVKEEIFAIAE